MSASAFQLEDSLRTTAFLQQVGKVELMSYRLGYTLAGENSEKLSGEFLDYNRVLAFRDSVEEEGSSRSSIHYYISEEEKDIQSITSYIDIIRKNDLYIAQQDTGNVDEGNSLIIEANKLGFKPFYKFRRRILTDIKFIIFIGILALFIITFFVLLFFIIIVRSRNARKERQVKEYEDTCREPLSTFLFAYDVAEVKQLTYEEINVLFATNDFKKPLFKDTLIKEIVNLNKNLKGDFKEKLKVIYTTLKLDDHSIRKLKSSNWELQATGTMELYEMNIEKAVPHLEKLLDSKNFVVRSTAVRAYLQLSSKKELSFLSQQNYPLSRWQQMGLYRVLRNTSSTGQIHLKTLLMSDNDSVRVFGVKLVRLLGRMDVIEKLSQMFPTASLEEQYEIIKTFNSLSAHTEIDLVHRSFQSKDIKLATLSAELMGGIGNEISVALLVEKLRTETPFSLEKCMMTSLYKLDEEMMNWVVGHFERPRLELIRKHIQDSLLENV
ncbi:hypothetical protein DN752_24020 [Echinicola strongylocentroti]|uniref:HEAT repeat domain-containing protein n=2 Tax=Echinicola strongylocentroti TaxID=1795355 RepID=A0A2Z4IQ68_9BACT|nr:hypothetical protein DN752_24020 [Echinicola strongylocentroti]